MGSLLCSLRCVGLPRLVIVAGLLLCGTSSEAQTGAPPVRVTLASLTGSVSTRRPALTWDAQPGVVYYLVRVMERTTTTDNWVTTTAAGCGVGAGTCTTTLGHDLDLGQVRWQALAWNTFGYGPWSSTQEFIANAVDPAAQQTTAQSPAGPLADEWVPFRWARVPDAVWYRLWRRDGANVEMERWFRPSEAGCASTGACQVTITPYLANGSGSWKVQVWTTAGSGPWSAELNFAVTLAAPATPQPATPNTTTTDRRPAFTWPATPHTWYYLLRVWVGSTFTDRWYTPDDAGCAPGNSTPCVVRPDATLAFGPVSWQLLAWNRSGYSEWSGLLTFLVVDQDPPTITATLSPTPDIGGWNSSTVTVTFTCADASGIAVCTPPIQVGGEGVGIPVTGTATDTAGNTTSNTWYVKIDRTAPIVHVFYPGEGSRIPGATRSVTIRGGGYDLSGLGFVSCGGVAAVVNGSLFSCTVDVSAGSNTVSIEARDLTGHTATTGVTFTVADTPLSSLDISPGTLTMFAGDSRELYVKDQNGKGVREGTWTVSDTSVARVAELNGIITVSALGTGTATLTVTRDSYTAHATVTVYSVDTTIPDGTTLWSLNDLSTWGAPKRGEVLRASMATPDPDPAAAPALFFVDEGSEWGAGSLVRLYERPTRIRSTTPDGRELSNVAFTGRLPQQIAADNAGGFIVVLPALGGQPSTLQRFDGRNGLVSWEYVPVGGFLTDAAVHPDGTVYLSEFHITGTSYLVAVTPGGGVRKWPLPRGHFQQKDTGACGFDQEVDTPAHASPPIIREDGVVIMLTHESFSSRPVYSYRDDQGNCHTQGSISNSLAQTAHVVTVTAAGELWIYPLNTAISDIPSQTLEQKALLPDGHDGLLLVDRKVPWAMRISPGSGYPAAIDYRVTAANFAILPADGTVRYEAEYVLGEDGVYAVVNSYRQTVGYAFYSKAIQFSAETLQRITDIDLGIPRPDPQHIRLKFALAGGGAYASGPWAAYVVNPHIDTAGFATGGNAVAVASEVWAGWNGDAGIETGASASMGATSWPWATGTDGRSNYSRPILIGIFMKGHDVAYPLGRHATIRITPKDQGLWLERRPDAFTHQDELGHSYATIGAGPGNGHQRVDDTTTDCGTYRLTDAISFATDATDPVVDLELLRYDSTQENALIQRLLDLTANYQDLLTYCFNPYYLHGPFYNSNSYISGLLHAAGLSFPLKPMMVGNRYLGWSKQVPASAFDSTK